MLVTGATGFVGAGLVRLLADNPSWSVRGATRRHLPDNQTPPEIVTVGELSSTTDWSSALEDVDAVVHTAARVHVMSDPSAAVDAFHEVNVAGTLNLARQAVSAGVKRFVFVSSIKVNGASTPIDRPFTADDPARPSEPYGLSKYEAELGLLKIANQADMDVVIVRPVLIYGPGVRANFLSLMRWLDKRVPLPFGSVANSRSFAALENVVDLLKTCLDHPGAGNQTFLVTDGEDLSTPELLLRMGRALGRPARLIDAPPRVLGTLARIVGKGDVAGRLLDSLRADIAKTRRLLGWAPPVKLDDALMRTARYFLAQKGQH